MPDLYIVEFKGYRRGYYLNNFYHNLSLQDKVIVEAERGEDLGRISKLVPEDQDPEMQDRPLSILRPAAAEDIEKWHKNEQDEKDAQVTCAELVAKHRLNMKLIDTEYQHDRNKLTFYFTSDQRVDFRALVRDLAAVFRTRIELRQIGVRDVAKRIGGYGICGLEQCCSAHLKRFEPITTSLAREQNLSLNPSKISGNCGRLLCCLTYEMEHYKESMGRFPDLGTAFETERGEGTIEAVNVFKDYMVVRHESGEMEKVTQKDLQRKNRKKTSFFKNWRDKLID